MVGALVTASLLLVQGGSQTPPLHGNGRSPNVPTSALASGLCQICTVLCGNILLVFSDIIIEGVACFVSSVFQCIQN